VFHALSGEVWTSVSPVFSMPESPTNPFSAVSPGAFFLSWSYVLGNAPRSEVEISLQSSFLSVGFGFWLTKLTRPLSDIPSLLAAYSLCM